MLVPIAAYFLESKSAQTNWSLAAPTIVVLVSCSQPPIFSGNPYLNLTKSPSIHCPGAPVGVACLLKPGDIFTSCNAITLFY